MIDNEGTTDGGASRSLPGHLASKAEIAAEYRRTARGLRFGVLLWLAFAPLSFGLALVYNAPWHVFVGTRLAVAAILMGAAAVERWGLAFTAGRVSVFSGGVASVVVFAMGVEAAFLGGARSAFAVGPAFGLVVLVYLQRHWRNAVLPMLATSLAYFAGLSAASPFALIIRSREDGFLLASELLLLCGLSGFCVYLSHMGWRLRRELFDATSLGRYELRRCIGRGGMGEVWRAYHTSLKRDVAVKILRADRMDAEAAARFEREVKATSSLTHPNTVRVFDYGVTDDGTLYYAMELLEGISVGALIKREGRQSGERAAVLVAQVARALAEAHAAGIIHRDLKPDNLIITQAGGEVDFVKVIDFGIARAVHDESNVTRAGEIAGTPAYMAPEVVEGKPAGARSDIYSLGVVLYSLLAGRPPFKEPSALLTMRAQVMDTVVSPREHGAFGLGEELEAICLRCLAKDADERFVDMHALANALMATPEYARGLHGPHERIVRETSAPPAPGDLETMRLPPLP